MDHFINEKVQNMSILHVNVEIQNQRGISYSHAIVWVNFRIFIGEEASIGLLAHTLFKLRMSLFLFFLILK